MKHDIMFCIIDFIIIIFLLALLCFEVVFFSSREWKLFEQCYCLLFFTFFSFFLKKNFAGAVATVSK